MPCQTKKKLRESEVFDQELSMDDLDATAGGGEFGDCGAGFKELHGGDKDKNTNYCARHDKRPISDGGFPN